jgi:hypothetical protein
MKKIIFGGFCLLSGIILFALMEGLQVSLVYGSNIPDMIVIFISVALAIYGFVLGISGLKSEK